MWNDKNTQFGLAYLLKLFEGDSYFCEKRAVILHETLSPRTIQNFYPNFQNPHFGSIPDFYGY